MQSAAEAMKDIDNDRSGPDYDARATKLFRSFSPPAGNCRERAFRRTEKRSVQSQESHIRHTISVQRKQHHLGPILNFPRSWRSDLE